MKDFDQDECRCIAVMLASVIIGAMLLITVYGLVLAIMKPFLY